MAAAHKLKLFSLVMITMSFMISIRNLPMLAETGWHQLFYMVVAGIIFLIPVGLVAAELSTAWPSAGGVYGWIQLALGDRWAFVAAWMLWVQMFFGMVMIGSFVAAMVAFVFDPALANNTLYICVSIIVVYWAVTALNFRGLQSASLISTIGLIVGVLIPFALILGFGVAYFMGNNPIDIQPFSWNAVLPDFSEFSNLTFFVGVIFLYAGLEVSSVHANEVDNPRKNYPLALVIAVVIIMCLNILGAFSIEIAEPGDQISLASGIMQTFTVFFTREGVEWLIPVVALMSAIGAVGQLSTWVLGPSKAMLEVAKSGFMPRWWHKTNRFGAPTRFMLVQATAVSLVALIYVVVPSVNAGFFMVLILTTILYGVMYVLLFISAIRLRYKFPDQPRVFKVPGGNIGMWIAAGTGLLTMLFCIFVSFIPPTRLAVGSPLFYSLFQILGLVIFTMLPLIIYANKKESWKEEQSKQST
ncbi:amino acid permease [Desulforhopalus vacuolatus]|uniref:amino acid permease n=1 Tax=Desulforhopalus vacuolatus TaxID=40414 RepID=UPI001966C5B6|nr:amino acid permease [Desulforhopalus vacuolatus]MBM9520487.1 amino acid permease [Desulforhopalus vacuolatus]